MLKVTRFPVWLFLVSVILHTALSTQTPRQKEKREEEVVWHLFLKLIPQELPDFALKLHLRRKTGDKERGGSYITTDPTTVQHTHTSYFKAHTLSSRNLVCPREERVILWEPTKEKLLERRGSRADEAPAAVKRNNNINNNRYRVIQPDRKLERRKINK